MEREDVVAGRERGRAAVVVALTAGAAAAVSYVVMWIATHALSTSEATVFLTVLAVLLFCYGILAGLATEVTRSTATAQRDGNASGPSLWLVGAVAAAVCSVVLVLFVVTWHDRLLGPGADVGTIAATALVMGVGVAGYAFHSTAVGALTGRAQWSGCATVIGGEAAARLLLTVAAAALGAGTVGMVAGSSFSALAVLVVLVAVPAVRAVMGAGTDCSGRILGWRIAQSMLAQASAAAVVVGFPVMLAATTAPADYLQAAPLILAISLTRAPLLVPLNAVQGVAVSYLVHADRRFGRALLVVVAVLAAAGALGILLAWSIGPWLMATLFGSDYRVEGWVLGFLTFSATLLALLTVTGATCQATNRHAAFVGGWLVATGTTACLLVLPGSIEQRSVVALLVGPAVGLIVHVVALARAGVDGQLVEGNQTHARA
jgi:hypothetical protein